MTLQVVDFSPAHLGALLQAKGQSLPPPAVVRALTVFDGDSPCVVLGLALRGQGSGLRGVKNVNHSFSMGVE